MGLRGVWGKRLCVGGGSQRFFYVGLMHESLVNMYQMNFALMHHHKYSLTELENMIPFERDVYVGLLKNYLEEMDEAQRSRR
jgi:hypothetical protein